MMTMNAQFQNGQLVAVRDREDQNWRLRVFDHCSEAGVCFCRKLDQAFGVICWWQVKPAEEVWPEIFLGRERNA